MPFVIPRYFRDPSRQLMAQGASDNQRDAEVLQSLPAIQNGVDTGSIRYPSGYKQAFDQAVQQAHEQYAIPPRAPAGQVTPGWWNRVGPGGIATLRGGRAGGIEGPTWQNIRAQNQEIARRRSEAADRVKFLSQPGAAAAFMGYQDPAPSYMNQLAAAVKLAEVGMNDEAQQMARSGMKQYGQQSGQTIPTTPASALQAILGPDKARELGPSQMTPDQVALELMRSQGPVNEAAMRAGLQAIIESGYAYKNNPASVPQSSAYQGQAAGLEELNSVNSTLVERANQLLEEQRARPTEEGLAKLSRIAEMLRENTSYKEKGKLTAGENYGNFFYRVNDALKALGGYTRDTDRALQSKTNYLMQQLGIQ